MPFTLLTFIETAGVVFGLLSVYYAAREDNRTWPAGLANVVLFGILFWASQLYINVGLQVFYFVYSLYGWWKWVYGGAGRRALPLALTPRRVWFPLTALTAAGTLAFGWTFDRYTDNPLPYWDAATVALSVAAQFMLTHKWLENWGVWIAANLIYIYLGLASGSYQFAALQVVYIALSVMGYRRWRRDWARAAEA